MLKTSSNYLDTANLSKADLMRLRDNAWHVLYELVTPQGIYASVDNGWSGPFHSWFGRDSAITAELICAAHFYGGDLELSKKAQKGLIAISKWQGKTNNPETGEETGKIPHEVRNEINEVAMVQHGLDKNADPWFIDPKDGFLKNWDSADSTPLWIISMIRLRHTVHSKFDEETLSSIRLGLEWILNNLNSHGGLLAFEGYKEQPGRKFGGLHNQGWKDSFQVYQSPDGTLAPHPIKDVLINAQAWAALRYGAGEFEQIDKQFAAKLLKTSYELKKRFNDSATGFLMPDVPFYAQAIDGKGRQLIQQAADVAMSLWAFYGSECIISGLYIDDVVKNTVSEKMFDPDAGIRNYALGTKFHQGTAYHGGTHTFWPFVSALIARGLKHFSYKDESHEIISAYLNAVDQLGSNVEMFLEDPRSGRLVKWKHPHVGQQSSVEQAWTAAAVYYGSLVLLSE